MLEAGLTGIVGPNGCGKSNIVEALRWAMGESSAKGLRGDGMEDVIFNGSAGRSAHDVAEVRLRLRGRPEGLTGFDGTDEFEIARKLSRGVGSAYRINGREVRARDVQLLFADAAAGARSPAIVGQGQIGFIVDSRPVDRRRLLEDAAGIGGLQARRREAELRLEATQANLQRVLDLLATQEARLTELAKQSRQAQRYRKLAAELRSGESLLLLARHRLAAEQLDAVVATVGEATAEHERLLAMATVLRRDRSAMATRLPPLREAVAEAQAGMATLRERLTSLRATAEREAAHRAALVRQHDEAAADLARARQGEAELRELADRLQDELAMLTTDRDRAAHRTEDGATADAAAVERLAAAQAALHALVAQAADARAQTTAAAERLAGLRARRDVIGAELRNLPDLAGARALQHRAETELAVRLQALDAARTSLAAGEEELAALEPQREAERMAAGRAEHALAEARQRQAGDELRLREIRAAATRLAERRAACERSAARLTERRAAQQARRDAFAHGAAAADVEARRVELAAAEVELAAADAVLDGARESLASVEQRRHEASVAARDLRRSADALTAEIKVLASLAVESEVGGLLDRLEVPDELAMAVAAALGDDLLAGTDALRPRFWRELEPAAHDGHGSPALPDGVPPLLGRIKAPALLHLRLAQIGLVEPQEAVSLQQRLQVGQRLVSVDGGLWRWDGFVRAPGSEDAATARVRHHLRLHAARDEAALLTVAVTEREAVVATAERAVLAARADLSAAEQCWRAADTAQLRARQRLEEAVAATERREMEAAQIDRDAVALEREAAEIAAEATDIDLSAAALDDEAAQTAMVAAAQAAVDTAAQQVRLALARQDRLEAAYEAAKRAGQAGRQRVEQAQAAIEPMRVAAEEAMRRADALEAEHRIREAALSREAEEIAAALATAEPAHAAFAAVAADRAQAQAVAEADLAAAEAAREAAAHAWATARAEATALARREELLQASRADATSRQAAAGAAAAELTLRRERLAAELAEADARPSEPEALQRLVAELAAGESAATTGRETLEREQAALATLEQELVAVEAALADQRERLAVAQSERSHAREALAGAAAAIRDRLQREPAELLADEALATALAEARIEELEPRLASLRAARDRLGAVNLRADLEVGELEVTIGETKSRQAELQQAIDRLRAAIATLDGEGRERLLAAFAAVDGHFRRLFAVLFGGGKAHLRLAGAEDPLRAGLELEASPPGKKLTSISLLSGGEKTLTALALVFAFFLAQPSPLCVLDEVDAPLDDANVDRFVALMREIAGATGTRFLCVTHHPLTMAQMDRLYGVTMAERGVSRLVSVALERALELRATA